MLTSIYYISYCFFFFKIYSFGQFKIVVVPSTALNHPGCNSTDWRWLTCFSFFDWHPPKCRKNADDKKKGGLSDHIWGLPTRHYCFQEFKPGTDNHKGLCYCWSATSWCSIAFQHIVGLPQKRQNGRTVHFQFCLWQDIQYSCTRSFWVLRYYPVDLRITCGPTSAWCLMSILSSLVYKVKRTLQHYGQSGGAI